ncbi:MAG: HEAT repeat domain-containing protein [FCB group bacterium]|nr:HEAT repeat domain-containing protein [FCB group bacterium]
MRKLLIWSMIFALAFTGCSRIKQLHLFGRKKTMGEINASDIERLRLSYQDGRTEALEELIAIFNDTNQPFDVRIQAGETLAETHHPLALNALAGNIAHADALDLTFMQESIRLLAEFRDNPKAADAMVQAMHAVEEKSNSLHMTLVKYLNRVRSKDQVYALLDLYEVSKANLSRTEKLMAETLGALGDDQVIPVLVDIAKDPDVSIAVRNRAVEILGKKDPTQVVGAFTELLGDPATMEEVRDFALNTMSGIKEENLVLTLLQTYNTGKKQYFSLLNTLLEALGNFDDPEVKSAVLEIALSSEYDDALRRKALTGLAGYKDPEILPDVIQLMESPDNYRLYSAVVDLIRTVAPENRALMDQLRLAELTAYRKAQSRD